MPESNQTMNSGTPPGAQTQDERMFAMFCHLSALVGFVFPFGNIIAPLVIWILKKDQYPLVNEHGKEANAIRYNLTLLKKDEMAVFYYRYDNENVLYSILICCATQ